MGAGEYTDWQRYYATEPFGFPREEFRFGVLASNIMAASTHQWRSSKVKQAAHWMYKPKTEVSDAEALELMRAQVPAHLKLTRVRSHGFEDS